MQQELKYEAFRMEAVRKSVENVCFDRCIPAPSSSLAVFAKALPDHIPGVQAEPSEVEQRTKYDLTNQEALCVDRCSWKYMMTAKICLNMLSKSKNIKDPQGGKM